MVDSGSRTQRAERQRTNPGPWEGSSFMPAAVVALGGPWRSFPSSWSSPSLSHWSWLWSWLFGRLACHPACQFERGQQLLRAWFGALAVGWLAGPPPGGSGVAGTVVWFVWSRLGGAGRPPGAVGLGPRRRLPGQHRSAGHCQQAPPTAVAPRWVSRQVVPLSPRSSSSSGAPRLTSRPSRPSRLPPTANCLLKHQSSPWL